MPMVVSSQGHLGGQDRPSHWPPLGLQLHHPPAGPRLLGNWHHCLIVGVTDSPTRLFLLFYSFPPLTSALLVLPCLLQKQLVVVVVFFLFLRLHK